MLQTYRGYFFRPIHKLIFLQIFFAWKIIRFTSSDCAVCSSVSQYQLLNHLCELALSLCEERLIFNSCKCPLTFHPSNNNLVNAYRECESLEFPLYRFTQMTRIMERVHRGLIGELLVKVRSVQFVLEFGKEGRRNSLVVDIIPVDILEERVTSENDESARRM